MTNILLIMDMNGLASCATCYFHGGVLSPTENICKKENDTGGLFIVWLCIELERIQIFGF